MPTRRVLKSILHNTLGAYASRSSDFHGYWLFGQLALNPVPLKFDLLSSPSPSESPQLAYAQRRAQDNFQDQLRKHHLPQTVIRSAYLSIDHLCTVSPAIYRPSFQLPTMHLHLLVTTDTNHTYQSSLTIFVAPHNPDLELRSSRV